ncbi:hypothetical protein [Chryseobacterium taichungense]|uniref:hypothetical protein n=1 Tax=Chryseobacterium taichungense TaxID=295069 RepID=UPI0028A68B82|nr:hypothetical protein [Chryseobacterium taichungense]
MKNNALSPHKKFGLEIENKNSGNQSLTAETKIDEIFPIWLAGNYSYYGPFMPMIDIAFVFDELKMIFEEWMATKNKN